MVTRVPPPGPHGGDAVRLARALGRDPAEMIDLSVSLNPFAPEVSRVLRRLLDECPDLVRRYPDDREATSLLARAIGEDVDRVVLTNGGAEAIALVAALEPDGEVVRPEFSLYERHLRRVRPGAPRWRSNPSNPLGRLADPEERAAVWDEAFYPLATGAWSRGDRTSWRLGSLTKLWACPGLRIGHAIAPTVEKANQLRQSQPRWSVNALALAALPRLLELTDLPRWAREVASVRASFVEQLRALGFRVIDTEANWVLVQRAGLREALAPEGVVVRDATSFGFAGLARVAVPHPNQFESVLAAFGRVGP